MSTPAAEGLNGIASILVDQIRLYERAAALSKDAGPTAAIRKVSKDREVLLWEVRRELLELGHADEVHGTMLGTVHKAFLEARVIVDDDTHAAIREVLRGEDYILHEVEKMITQLRLNNHTRTYLATFRGRLKSGHTAIQVIHEQMH